MRNLLLATVTAFALAMSGGALVAGETNADSHEEEQGHQETGHEEEGHEEGGHQEKVACTAPVHITEAAENKLGGKLYTGSLPKAATMENVNAQARKADSEAMQKTKGMAGSHNVHKGIRGGEFLMVLNQLHHMEALYTAECGFQLYLYNAYSEPISVDRFQAMLLVLPEDGDQFFDVMRFLEPALDNGVLQTRLADSGHDDATPEEMFEAELYVKFPESIHPQKYDLILETEASH